MLLPIYALVGLLAVGASAAPATEAKASSKSSSTAKVTKANLTPTLKKDSLRCATSNGEPLFPGIYREPYRPQIHHSISHGFSNDPNGLIYVNGTYHLYFQYSPHSTVAGNQHWGHSTSTDLYTWTHHEPALKPEAPGEGIFSGSAVLDVNNTSGLFAKDTDPNKRFILIYTLNTPTLQDQHIAYGDGYKFTKYKGNPVLSEPNQTQFRDPKVNWDADAKLWRMAVAHPQVFQVTFYSSPDLKKWTETSRFASGLQGYQFECPGVEKVKAVGGPRDGQMLDMLLLSIKTGSPLGGSIQQYFLGDFKNGTFKSLTDYTQIMDTGKDLYAGMTFYGAPEATFIAWCGNWDYAQQVPTATATKGWRSEMTLPRILRAQWTEVTPQYSEYRISQQPFDLTPLSGKNTAPTDLKGNVTTDLSTSNGAFNIQATFSLPASSNFTGTTARINVRTKTGVMTFGITFGLPVFVWADRRKAGGDWADKNQFFTDRFSHAQMPLRRVAGDAKSDYIVKVQLVVDRIVSEIFVNDGQSAGTHLHFWPNEEIPSSLDVQLESPEIRLEAFTVVPLKSTWDCII